MVQQRSSSRRECCWASSAGDGITARRRRRDAAIVEIKTQLLRCSSRGDKQAGRQRRFKRPYYAAGDRGNAAAVLYLACLVSMYRAAASSRLVPGVDDLGNTTACAS